MSGMLQQLDEIPLEINVKYNKNLPHTCKMVSLSIMPISLASLWGAGLITLHTGSSTIYLV